MPESTDTWPSVIESYASSLGSYEQIAITSEEEHRQAFEELCNQHKERDPRLLTKFHRTHARIEEFAITLDSVNRLDPNQTLSAVFWQLNIIAIKSALNTPIKVSDFLKETNELNKHFPTLSREQLTRFSHDPSVQGPLQELFKKYIDCYMSMLPELATYPSIVDLEKFRECIEGVSEVFLAHQQNWELARRNAEKEERRLHSLSTPSSPNGALVKPHRSNSTSAHFTTIEALGHGTYGEVSRVMEPTTKKEYVQKLVRVRDRGDSKARDLLEKQVQNEVDVMQKLSHHHIASVLFYVKEFNAFSIIMLPVADYELHSYMEVQFFKAENRKNEIHRLDRWFGCLVSALAYAHEQKIKHEDIKPSNILIKGNRIYLADFGSAKDFSLTEASASPDYMVAGTPVYWPPESPEDRGRPADIFALGCVFSEMLTIRQNRTLEEYRTARHVSGTDNPRAFYKNLDGIKQWLNGLSGTESDIPTLLLKETLYMLRSKPDERRLARDIKKKFRAEEEALFCHSC